MDKTEAASRGSTEVLHTLPMSLTLKLKVGKHRISSHVELGSLEVQLTAIMSSLSILEHCHSQMKGTWEANMLNSSIHELSALRHLVLKFARRLPLLEAEEFASSDHLGRWTEGLQLEEPHQMRASSSEDSVSGPSCSGVPSAPTSATSFTSQQSCPLKDKSSSKSSNSSGSPADDHRLNGDLLGSADGASAASGGEKTRRFRARILSVMKGLLSRKQTRVQTLKNHSDDDDDDDDNHGIDSESDEGMDVMSSVVPVPPHRVVNAVPPRSAYKSGQSLPERAGRARLQHQRRS
ncbi:unnamed protein product [Cladocopium goreaui]|uniref:Uncharacterized protein n=1 Tax=Cladocopium goreaui TaxID=2562237 RepID=A0A9P1C684_9DINO|nr:unnamed protein product [Cladocopium goreaui]